MVSLMAFLALIVVDKIAHLISMLCEPVSMLLAEHIFLFGAILAINLSVINTKNKGNDGEKFNLD